MTDEVKQLIETARKAQAEYFAALTVIRQDHGIDISALTPACDWDFSGFEDEDDDIEDDGILCSHCGYHTLSGNCPC